MDSTHTPGSPTPEAAGGAPQATPAAVPTVDAVAELRERSLTLLEFPQVCQRLAAHAATSMGHALALALRPSYDVEEVRRLQRLTTDARRLVEGGDLDLGRAQDVRPLVERAVVGGMLTGTELLQVQETLRAARTVRQTVLRRRGEAPAVAEVAEGVPELKPIEDAVLQGIRRDGEVDDNATPELARLRSESRGAYQRLMDHLHRIIRSSLGQEVLQEPIITERNGRMVLLLKAEFRGRMRGIVHDVSDSGATLFVEPLGAVGLGNQWKELRLQEQREAERVLRRLSAMVGDAAEQVLLALELLGRLDLYLAKARYAQALGAAFPVLLEEARPWVRLVQARHPLLRPPVVPVGLELGREWTVLLITGPNAGGKTVALKTLGLLVLMHQAGLHLPAAEGTALGLFDGVYADIGDQQSIERSLSTFSSHVSNLRAVLEAATPRSLVLVDELGTSTDPEEGVALAKALLREFHRRGVAIAATTHHRELAATVQETPGMMNASVELDPKTLAPTYRLTLGLPGRSYALAIARRLGLPERVLQEAHEALPEGHRQAESLLADLQRERAAAEAARRRAEAALAEAERARRDAQQRLEELRGQEAVLVEEARRELEARAEALRRQLKEAEQELARGASREALRQAAAQVGAVRRELERSPAWTPIYGKRTDWVRQLKAGDRVWVRGISQPAEVVTPPDSRGILELKVGAFRMQMHASQVERPAASAPQPGPPPVEGVRVRAPQASAPVAPELVLVGQRVEAALERLEEHLHRASYQGLTRLRVVHGAGTGALRAAVRQHLARHPLVAGFHSDESRAGDTATIVELG